MRMCVVCGGAMEGKPVQWRTCSRDCSATLKKEDNRKRLAEYRSGARAKRIAASDRKCLGCGKPIDDLHPNAKTCSLRCLQDITNTRARERKRRRTGCIVCGTSLAGTHGGTKTCSNECRQEHQRQYSRAYYADFGRKTQNAEARKAYMREYSKRNKAQLDAKKAAYREAHLELLKQAEKERLARDGDAIRARARLRHQERRAALKLIRELEANGKAVLL